MSLLRIIIANIVILNILLWINHEILHIFRFKKSILLRSILGGALGAIFLLLYQQGTILLPLERGLTTDHSIYSFLTLILSIVLLFALWRQPWKNNYYKNIIYLTVMGIIGYLLVSNIGNSEQFTSLGLFYLLAFAEENIKTLGIRHRANKILIKHSDLIICGVISGLGFAFVENIVVSSSAIHSINRLPLFFIHILFSSYIAYGIVLSQKKKKEWLFPLMLISITLLHTAYNTRGSQIGVWTRILLAVGLYFLYTIVQYNSHSLYMTSK